MRDGKGDDMQNQASTKIIDEAKGDENTAQLSEERRSMKSERRIRSNHEYIGPARRMNIDRRE